MDRVNTTTSLIRLLLGLICLFWLQAAPQARADGEVKVLIIDGFSNHDWRTTTRRIVGILQKHGGFATTVSTSPGAGASAADWDAWRPAIAGQDVVLLNCNDLGNPVDWPDRVRDALEHFVQDGGGLYVFHSANNAFAQWPEYNRMIGLGWRDKSFGPACIVNNEGKVERIPAGQGENTSHGDRVDALVTRVGDHPIHRGLPRQWRAADIEVYTYARGPAENMEILAYSKDNRYGLGFPTEWVVHYGRGNVYNATYGHLWTGMDNPPGFRCAGFQTILVRALFWLANKPVPDSAPEDFPGSVRPSLRD